MVCKMELAAAFTCEPLKRDGSMGRSYTADVAEADEENSGRRHGGDGQYLVVGDASMDGLLSGFGKLSSYNPSIPRHDDARANGFRLSL